MSLLDQLKFDKDGLLPCITQDAENGEVLMLAYMNAEAVENTLKTGKVHYYSRSRGKQWMKGESSGHVQTVREIRYDCDKLELLVDDELWPLTKYRELLFTTQFYVQKQALKRSVCFY